MFKFTQYDAAMPQRALPQMRRAWVETGDARCPLACVWFALGPAKDVCNEQAPSEGERIWPALLRMRGGGQAFSSALHLAA